MHLVDFAVESALELGDFGAQRLHFCGASEVFGDFHQPAVALILQFVHVGSSDVFHAFASSYRSRVKISHCQVAEIFSQLPKL
jgi:hypothetical protein